MQRRSATSAASTSCSPSSPASSALKPNRGAHASTTGRTCISAAGMGAHPGVTCRIRSLSKLCALGQRMHKRGLIRRPHRPVLAQAVRPLTADPPRKPQHPQPHRSAERSLLAGHWCWEWRVSRWRASLLFLLASVAFFGASAAAMCEPASTALVAYPYAVGSVLFTLGAHQYKRAALEGLQSARRRLGREHSTCAWARTEVRGTQAIVIGCELGILSTSAPILLAALPAGLATSALLTSAEAWLTSVLNVISGVLFVSGSYVILGAMYGSLAPGAVFAPQNLREFKFWGSACYLVGSVGLLLAAVLTQPLHPLAPALSWWGHFLGYVIGSLWFTAGACAQIADVAHETALAAAKEQCSQP
ncbi:hypothetical protein COCOBI_11-5010 [Coccomyxa sp. Obi]|nr:hypothetical protein COCOBI_11-5010 [Coccomyxa sp. Obi]